MTCCSFCQILRILHLVTEMECRPPISYYLELVNNLIIYIFYLWSNECQKLQKNLKHN